MTEAQRTISSPVGDLVLTASETGLTGVYFGPHPLSPSPVLSSPPVPLSAMRRGGTKAVLDRTEEQLKEYFAGKRTTFDLPLEPSGTAFQLSVWELLRKIPYGVTTSYGELARRLGEPKASRAVGAANGANPIPIIVPCHRVVGSRGELTGFGGGIDRKRWLLEHEGALIPLGDR
ncbi:MAG TPA: methylated-DNA--[protein]-cysteine S-methyltransferase [Gemmatimonadales bacterium]|nr:methylated-DNA--[protein]-cysteine S-methyltransferase [Gemmatimonadales bacterium]